MTVIMKMLEENDSAYGRTSTSKTFDNKSMICEFRTIIFRRRSCKPMLAARIEAKWAKYLRKTPD